MSSAQENNLPVSVVIPTYNGQAYVAEALESVFAQSRLPSEIVVVDDASSDGTVCRVNEMAGAAPVPLRLIRLTENSGGPARPMNVGIEAARWPLIAVLDQDDVFTPRRLQRQASILCQHPRIAMVFAHVAVKPEQNTGPLDASPLRMRRHWDKVMACKGDFAVCDGMAALRVLLNCGNCIGGFPGFTFRRDHWRSVGGLDERLMAVDYDLLCLLCQRGQVAMVPEVQYLYRFHQGNLTRSRALCYSDEIATLAKYTDCQAWARAPREVRRAISRKLYDLAVLLACCGHARLARRFLAASLPLGSAALGLVRWVDYPIKVARRRRRAENCNLRSDDVGRAVHCLETVLQRYAGRWWRRLLPAATQPPTIHAAECPIPLDPPGVKNASGCSRMSA